MLAFSKSALVRFVGVPWVSGGRDPVRGCDCWGLILAAARECYDIVLPDYVGYTDADNIEDTRALFAERSAWQRLSEGAERAGDVVVMKLLGSPSHAGLVVDTGLMLHTLRGRDSCIERYRSLAWAERLEGFYRWAPR